MSAWRLMGHQARVAAVRGCLNKGGMDAPAIAARYGAALPVLEYFIERHRDALGIPAGSPAPVFPEPLPEEQGCASAPEEAGGEGPERDAAVPSPPATPDAVASAPGTLLWLAGDPGDGTLLDLKAWDCRWIDGDPREPGWRFCCAPRQPGSSYCADHHSRCYTRHVAQQKRRGVRDRHHVELA